MLQQHALADSNRLQTSKAVGTSSRPQDQTAAVAALHCFGSYVDGTDSYNNRHFTADRQLKLNFHLPKTTKKNRKMCPSVWVA
jgi:hypothetical protein